MWTRMHFAYLLAAAVIFLFLHLYFVLSWDSLYAPHPWRGYAPGVAPPFFTSSPRSELVAGAVLFAMTLGMTLLPAGRAALTGVAIWAGVMAAVVVLWVATPPLRNDSDMWPIDLVFLAVNTGVPILLGWIAGLAVWRLRSGRWREPEP